MHHRKLITIVIFFFIMFISGLAVRSCPKKLLFNNLFNVFQKIILFVFAIIMFNVMTLNRPICFCNVTDQYYLTGIF
uniref:Putative nadh dehydrogenase subunit 4l mitochondrion n=1 Tax=Xenopsylla cheopis TaxID=163159 RepID=A0A6M2DZM4_XENCH